MAFLLWAAVLILFIPVLKLNLYLFDPFLAAALFISCLLLVLAWALAGPLVAAVLSLLSAVIVVYLGLGAKEPSLFLQMIVYALLFFSVSYGLYLLQRKTRNQSLARERLAEAIHLAQKEIQKKELLKKALQKKIDHFLDLQRFSEELKQAAGLEAMGAKIVHGAREVVGKADECALYLVDEDEQQLRFLAGVFRDGRAAGPRQATSFDQWAMKRGQALMVEDARNDFRFAAEWNEDSQSFHSVCVSPLVTEKRVLGVVRANSAKVRSFTADDLRLLDMFSSLGAVALRNVLLYERLGELATRDSLTGLYVNRCFQERLSREWLKAASGRAVFSLLLLDIDYFKEYNDLYGHAAGDGALKMTASLVRKCLGPDDLAARYGGEEFAVLLAGKDKGAALAAAEAIRAEIEKNAFVLRRSERRVTVSLGVASHPEDGRTAEELLLTADKHLYEAKKAGRNRVVG